MKQYNSVFELDSKEIINGTLLTGFRPSTYRGGKESIGMTLGHRAQLDKIKYLQDQGCNKLYIIIADVQGFADKVTMEHAKLVQEISFDYASSLFASLGEDVVVFRESRVRGQVAHLTDVLQDYMYMEDFSFFQDAHSGSFFDNRAMRLGKKGKATTVSNLLTALTGQVAHIVGAEATLVPSGADEFAKTRLAGKVVDRINHEFATTINMPNIIGSNEMVLGTDGMKMSTNSRNYITTKDTPKTLEGKIKQMSDDTLLYYYHTFVGNVPCSRGEQEMSVQRNLQIVIESMSSSLNQNQIEEKLRHGEQTYNKKIEQVIDSLSLLKR